MITGLSDSTALKTDIILELKSLYGLSNTHSQRTQFTATHKEKTFIQKDQATLPLSLGSFKGN